MVNLFYITGSDDKQYARQHKGERLHQNYVKKSVKYGGGDSSGGVCWYISLEGVF